MNVRRRLATRLIGLYPRRWRRRYAVEVATLLEEHHVRLATLWDLLAGALDARCHRMDASEEELMFKSRERTRRYTRCSFCGKGQDQVKRLIAGPGVYICDGCVQLCNEVLADPGATPKPQPPAPPPPSSRRQRRWWPWHFIRRAVASG